MPVSTSTLGQITSILKSQFRIITAFLYCPVICAPPKHEDHSGFTVLIMHQQHSRLTILPRSQVHLQVWPAVSR